MTRVLVTAHDPGGANALVDVVSLAMQEGAELLIVLAGPAREVFKTAGIAHLDAEQEKEDELLTRIDAFAPELFLAGTNMMAGIERRLFTHVRARAKTLYVLDFWSNYTRRFSKNDNDLQYLPDRICVPDTLAVEEMLEEGFPKERIVATGNPYFEHFTDGVTTNNEEAGCILFISQPVSETKDSTLGFDEHKTLREVIEAVKGMPENYRLVIRLHPREDARKYDAMIGERVSLSSGFTVEEDLSRAGLVIGMFSPVLMQAAWAGKSVFSFEPGLTGKDPFPLNRAHEMPHAYDTEGLRRFLLEYQHGTHPMPPKGARQQAPLGAAKRIWEEMRRLVEGGVYYRL